MSSSVHISKNLQQEAQNIIKQINLSAFLTENFEVFYTGSYAYDLMCWRNIDISLKSKNNKNVLDCLDAVISKLIKIDSIANIQFINGINHETSKAMPKGYAIKIELTNKKTEQQWFIDIWALDKQHFVRNRKFDYDLSLKLTDALKEKIINLKFEYLNNKSKMPPNMSYHIYQAILFKKLSNIKEIKNYLANKIL